MGLSFYYIPRFQTPTPVATCLNTPQTVTFQPLTLGNIKRFWKKLLESGTWRNYQNIRTTHPILANGTFIVQYSKVPHPPLYTQTHTPRYHSNNHNLISGTGVKGPLKKLIESEKIRKTLRIPTNGSSIDHIKRFWKADNNENLQLGPNNWKTVKNYEYNQCLAARA